MRGRGHTLVDAEGREHLDTRNNVPHVGHCNARVAAAVAAQVQLANTNTRYPHPLRVRLCERLLGTFSAPELRGGKVFLVNSGSEANDLALRLARAKTGRLETLVLEHAYHGHTCAVVGISPYKSKYFEAGSPKGGQPAHVRQLPAPDGFRGAHTGADSADRYAEYVERAAAEAAAAGGLCSFIVESGMSVAGVILPPAGWLARCFAAVRAAGGVCIADEVQTGFGRMGSHWWCFELQGATPDIVTMGKPFGNGMPLAAVVCTQEVAAAFAEGPEYFNTFGGNPTCCAAGLAVLDEIESRGLMAHAERVGRLLRARLRMLADGPGGGLVADVRGAPLFCGLELCGPDKAPATAATSWICSQLYGEHAILTSVDGPHDNGPSPPPLPPAPAFPSSDPAVLVIKPPMTFDEGAVERLCTALQVELARVPSAQELAGMGRTPT